MRNYILVAASACALLASCGEPTKTVTEFKADEEARIGALAKCRENPGAWDTTPNCGNAEAATRQMIEDVHQAAIDEAKPLQDRIVEISRACLTVPPMERQSCNQQYVAESQELTAQTREIADRSNARKRELAAQIQRR
ncbi:MAG: EexN family lipoprotein [Pseudomonadota bacterium]